MEFVFEPDLVFLLLFQILIHSNVTRLRSGCIVSRLPEVDRIEWLGNGLSTNDLAGGQLRLANLVIGLALRRKFVASMSIFNREVALLKTFTSFFRFIVSTDECVGWWGSIHDSRTSLSCLIVYAKSEVTRPQVFRLLRNLLTNV